MSKCLKKFHFIQIGYIIMLKPSKSEVYVTHLPVVACQRWVSGTSKRC